MSYTQLLYHIVFSTSHRRPTITETHSEELYRLINHILKRENCTLHSIGGIENHIHILASVPPDKTLSKIVQNIKRETSLVLANHESFPLWDGWNEGYGAFSCSWADREAVTNYIKRQKEHHIRISVNDEIREFLREYGFQYSK